MSCDHWTDGTPCPCYADVERLRATLRDIMCYEHIRLYDLGHSIAGQCPIHLGPVETEDCAIARSALELGGGA